MIVALKVTSRRLDHHWCNVTLYSQFLNVGQTKEGPIHELWDSISLHFQWPQRVHSLKREAVHKLDPVAFHFTKKGITITFLYSSTKVAFSVIHWDHEVMTTLQVIDFCLHFKSCLILTEFEAVEVWTLWREAQLVCFCLASALAGSWRCFQNSQAQGHWSCCLLNSCKIKKNRNKTLNIGLKNDIEKQLNESIGTYRYFSWMDGKDPTLSSDMELEVRSRDSRETYGCSRYMDTSMILLWTLNVYEIRSGISEHFHQYKTHDR